MAHRPRRRPPGPLAATALLAACGGPQSALAPAGPEARTILDIGHVLFVGGTIIFLAVMAVLAYAVVARPERFRGGIAWIVGGGLLVPAAVLFALQIYEFAKTRALVADDGPAAAAGALRITVEGRMWWWEVRYPELGTGGLRTANEIVVPAGRPIAFELTTGDVIHSFWMPTLSGKLDMIPGRTNRFTLVADTPGVYRGQCAEYCGAQHALMAFDVIVLAPDAFDAWARAQAAPAAEPATGQQVAGRAAFLEAGCGACHTVRGTAADGTSGPDLTHVGRRLTLGAGMFPNGRGALAGWIASAQHLKPENRMPSFALLDGVTLRALAAYLEGLK